MTTSNFSSGAVGWVAITTGVAGILALVFLILLTWIVQPFGTLNDVFNSVIGISSAILAWMLYAEHHSKSPLLSQLALVLALVGAILTIVGSVLVISKTTGFVLAGWYTGVGDALIGLWLAAFCYSMRGSDTLPHNLVTFGLVVGVVMALGILDISGIVAGIDSMESIPWYLYIGYFGFLGTYVLYPIWAIRLGRFILSRI